MKIIAPLSISHESEVYVICGISCSVPKLMHVYFTRVNCLYFVFYLVFLFLSFFFFGHAHGIRKFLGQESNPCHSNDLSHSSDNASFLTHCTIRELQFPLSVPIQKLFLSTTPLFMKLFENTNDICLVMIIS